MFHLPHPPVEDCSGGASLSAVPPKAKRQRVRKIKALLFIILAIRDFMLKHPRESLGLRPSLRVGVKNCLCKYPGNTQAVSPNRGELCNGYRQIHNRKGLLALRPS